MIEYIAAWGLISLLIVPILLFKLYGLNKQYLQIEHQYELLLERASNQDKLIFEQDQRIKTLATDAEEKLKSWKIQVEKQIRQDANTRSRSVLRGQATEHLAPLMLDDYDLKDYRFIGHPIDYLICNGSSAIQDGVSDTIESIVLLDIKTGKSELNKIQRRIRDAVVDGRVVFAIYNPDKQETRIWRKDDDQKKKVNTNNQKQNIESATQ